MHLYHDFFKVFWNYAIFTCLFFYGPGLAFAAEIPRPTGPVILTIQGAIENRNTDTGMAFDFDMLAALPRHTVRTTTTWTQGEQTFDGVRMADIISYVGATGDWMTAYALNDYFIEISFKDFSAFDVLLTDTHNGARMSVRDKGPLWIIYPNVEPTSDQVNRMVWQLVRIVVSP